jgi:hypothetical protein
MRAKELVEHLNLLIKEHGEDIPVFIMQYCGGEKSGYELLWKPKFFPKGISNECYLATSIDPLPDRLVIEG